MRQRPQQEDGAVEEQQEEKKEERRGEEQTDKIREPLTEVREISSKSRCVNRRAIETNKVEMKPTSIKHL